MSTEGSKVRIGAFVVGGIALLVLGILALGGKKLLSDDVDYVLYFDGSVSGLSIGAPVVFRGVPMGNVTKITLVANSRDEGVTIPVFIRIDESNIVRMGTDGTISNDMREEIIRRMVRRGLRARLQMQSFITGQYRIELDFFPGTPARYHTSDHTQEIPTVPSPLDEFQKTLTRLPLESIATSLQEALTGVAQIANSKEIHEAITAFRGTFVHAQELFKNMESLPADARGTFSKLNNAAGLMDKQLPETVLAFQLAMKSLAAAAQQMEQTLASAKGVVGKDSQTVSEFNQALKEFNATARSIRELTNMLERNPEALLLGKGKQK
ncbi:MAG: MlaD family protein [Desulfovibrionaceae bacterium]